jgi:branched-chain amino acid transport system substrate-binding protein
MQPAGFDASQGIISSSYMKDPTDLQWKSDPGMKEWNAFLDKYYPDANRTDAAVIYAYTIAQALEHVLNACGDNLTRENVMKQAASIKDLSGRPFAGHQGQHVSYEFYSPFAAATGKVQGRNLGTVR